MIFVFATSWVDSSALNPRTFSKIPVCGFSKPSDMVVSHVPRTWKIPWRSDSSASLNRLKLSTRSSRMEFASCNRALAHKLGL